MFILPHSPPTLTCSVPHSEAECVYTASGSRAEGLVSGEDDMALLVKPASTAARKGTAQHNLPFLACLNRIRA